MDSYAVVKNDAEKSYLPFTQFFPKVTHFITILQYNQDIDNDTFMISNMPISTRILGDVAFL